jgi:hypothetical protein
VEIYIDDIKIVGSIMQKCQTVHRELGQYVKVESKGPIESFHGIKSFVIRINF